MSPSAGFLIPAFLLVSTSYVGCDNTSLAVVLFTLALGVQSFNSTSYSVNHLDIAPRFAGILVGITNSFGTVPGIVGPYIIGYLTDNQVMLFHLNFLVTFIWFNNIIYSSCLHFYSMLSIQWCGLGSLFSYNYLQVLVAINR